MKIKAILFDFGGTLDSDGIDWFTRIYKIVTRLSGPIDKDEFQKLIRQAADEITQMEDSSTLPLEGMASRICRHTHTIMSQTDHQIISWNPEEVVQEFLAETIPVLKRNLPCLEKLHKKFRLGCISNNWGNTAGWCQEFQFDRYFETMIDSTVVGYSKPDQHIFQAALNELQLPPEACVYVGDYYTSDIQGAAAAGLTPVWITNGVTPLPPDVPVNLLRIKQLPDLLNMTWN